MVIIIYIVIDVIKEISGKQSRSQLPQNKASKQTPEQI